MIKGSSVRTESARSPNGAFGSKPGPTQESVRDYPRPPSVEQTGRHIVITFAGGIVAESTRAWRVCETSHPPVYYLPPDDIAEGVLVPAGGSGSSYCEFQGSATYWSLVVGGRSEPEVAWSYERPSPWLREIGRRCGVLSGPSGRGEHRRGAGSGTGRWVLWRLDHRRVTMSTRSGPTRPA